MRRTLHFFLVTLTLLFAYTGGGNLAFAETYEHTFSKGELTLKAGTDTLSGVPWTQTAVGYVSFGAQGSGTNYGFQIGSAKNPASDFKLSTTGFSGVITSVKVNGKTGGAATLTVSVGGTTYDTKDMATDYSDYEFTGTSSGELIINLKSSSKAAYLVSITVTYSTDTSKGVATLAWSESTAKATVGQAFTAPTLSAKNSNEEDILSDLSISYTSSNTDAAKVDDEGNITLVGEGVTQITAKSSETDDYYETSASYTLTVYNAVVSEVTVTTEASYQETMTYSLGSFTASGTYGEESDIWTWNSQYTCAKALASTDAAVTGYLTSPKITLSSEAAEANITFQHAGKNFGTISDEVGLEVSEDGSNWTALTIDNYPTNWTFVDASVDLTAYIGKSIYLRFSYSSTTSNAGTWEVKNIEVSESSQIDVTLSFENAQEILNIGGTYTQTATTNTEGVTGVTYSSSNTSVATVDATTGEVSALAGGTAIITASFAGNDTYKEAEDVTYIVGVANAIENGVFDFTAWQAYGSGMTPSTTDAISTTTHTFTAENVTLSYNGKHRWWYTTSGNHIRLFKADNSGDAGNFTVSVGSNYLITKIAITGSGHKSLTADVGTYSNATWTGESSNVTFTYAAASGNIQVKTVIVTYVNLTTFEETSTSYTAATEEAVKVKRTFNEGWNAVVLPYAISDVTAIFGDGSKVATLSSATLDETADVLHLVFDNSTALEAGVPCFLYCAQGSDCVMFSDASNPAAISEQTVGNYTVKGIYCQTSNAIAENDIIISRGNLAFATKAYDLKGFRSYIVSNSTATPARSIVAEMDGKTTSIETLFGNDETGETFDLAGRKVTNPRKGIYLRNGKKYVVK